MRTTSLARCAPLIGLLVAGVVAGCDHNDRHYHDRGRDHGGWDDRDGDHGGSWDGRSGDRGNWDGRHVQFDGTVTRIHDGYDADGRARAYQVSDGRDSVWVRSSHGAPSVGDRLTVSGTAHADGRFGSDNLGPMVDEDSRTRR